MFLFDGVRGGEDSLNERTTRNEEFRCKIKLDGNAEPPPPPPSPQPPLLDPNTTTAAGTTTSFCRQQTTI